MPKKIIQKDRSKVTLASVKKEMAKPRVAKSARKKYANLDLSAVLTESRKPSSREAARSQSEAEPLRE